MVVGFGGRCGLQTELNGLFGLTGDLQRKLAVGVAVAFDLLAEHHDSHARHRMSLAVAKTSGKRLHGLRHVEGDGCVLLQMGQVGGRRCLRRNRRSDPKRQPQPGHQACTEREGQCLRPLP